jgi:hypothetical protein
MPWPDALYEIQQRHAGMQGGFCLLANVKQIVESEPFEVTPGVLLRPAQEDEALTFKELLSIATRRDSPPYRYRNPYEIGLVHESISPDLTRTRYYDLPAEEHRYCVAAFTESNIPLYHVIDASVLTSRELAAGIEVTGKLAGFEFGLGWGSQLRIMDETRIDDGCLITLERNHLEDLKLVASKLQQHKDDNLGLLPALRQFQELNAIPVTSPLRFLGYFAILESLITHEQKANDPYSSLTRQVRQKMLLLGRRVKLPFLYERLEQGQSKLETIWNTLYGYRSAIAHGGLIDFSSKFKILGSPEQAVNFIKAATASVMRHALDEPELISDLREC